jgi:bifunctional DNase/RNase
VIEMLREDQLITVDARPSDAIALALRVDFPIYVNEEVIKNSSATISEEPAVEDEEWPDDFADDSSGYKM